MRLEIHDPITRTASHPAVTPSERAMNGADSAAQAAFTRGLAHHRAGRLAEASAGYREALALAPGHTEALHLAGVAAQQSGKPAEAAQHIEAAIRAGPETTDQHNNLGEAYRALGRLEDAARSYQRALAIDASNAGALANLGLALESMGRLDEALSSVERSLGLDDDPQVRWNRAGMLERAGRLDEALAAYRELAALVPVFDAARMRAAHVLLTMGRHAEALESFDALAARHGREPAPLVGAARALHGLGHFADAEQRARAALRVEPEDIDAHAALGLALFERGALEDASEAFLAPARRIYARHASPGSANLWRSQVTRTKLRHDLGQFAHLAEQGADADEPLVEAHRKALDALPADGATAHFSVPADSAFGPWYNRVVNDWRAPAAAGGALAAGLDCAGVERAFLDNPGAYACVDGLLSPDALASLQRFCAESSVWFETKFRDEVGASLRGGFACPLLLQIAEEVRAAFPAIFAGMPLADCFAYKYFQDDADGHVHADIGAATVNLWITPDEANLDADTGGLMIWNKRVPNRYFDATPGEKDAIERTLVGEPDARAERIAYRCNRAMLFRSSVLHKSDRMRFRQGYLDRRVSVAMMFGEPPRD